MAGEALRVAHADWARQVQRTSEFSLTLVHQFLRAGVVAEVLHHVRFPGHRPVPGIGRIQRRFAIGELRTLLAQRLEHLRCGIRWHTLRKELRWGRAAWTDEQRLDFSRRVVPRALRTLEQQSRIRNRIVSGFVQHSQTRDNTAAVRNTRNVPTSQRLIRSSRLTGR